MLIYLMNKTKDLSITRIAHFIDQIWRQLTMEDFRLKDKDSG